MWYPADMIEEGAARKNGILVIRYAPGSAVQSRVTKTRDACPAQPGPSLGLWWFAGPEEEKTKRKVDKVAVLARLFARPAVTGHVAMTARPSASRPCKSQGARPAATMHLFPPTAPEGVSL